MLYLGCHLSSSKGYAAMGRTALSIGANTFQFFTRNPRGGAAAKVEEADVAAFRAWAAEQGFGPLVAHSPYTLNPCSDKPSVRDFAKRAFTEDLERMELTPDCFYNFHPGSAAIRRRSSARTSAAKARASSLAEHRFMV